MPKPAVAAEGIPDEAKPQAHFLTAALLDGLVGVRRAVRSRDTGELRELAVHLARCERELPGFMEALGLPPMDGPSWWVTDVLPIVRAELERRSRPRPRMRGDGPIARLKSLEVVAVAERFTTLQASGVRLKGLCPLHSERTPSFYVYPDHGRWHCFGACATGGDVIDLLERLKARGKFT